MKNKWRRVNDGEQQEEAEAIATMRSVEEWRNLASLHHLIADRLAFLQAARAASLVPENGTAPTNKGLRDLLLTLEYENSRRLKQNNPAVFPKSSGQTRRSNGSLSDATLDGILKCLSNGNTATSITKKNLHTDCKVAAGTCLSGYCGYLMFTAIILACLLVPLHHPVEDTSDSKAHVKGTYLVETCRSVVSAFTFLRRGNKQSETLPFCKEPLFTAATILAMEPWEPLRAMYGLG